MHPYVYLIRVIKGSFSIVLGTAATTAAAAASKGLILELENLKKQKNVSTMSKKTVRCSRKIIKNSKKRPKTIKIAVIDVNFVGKGVFFVIFEP